MRHPRGSQRGLCATRAARHALCTADVVVTHADQNAVAEVAAARAPAVVVADKRPFDEQLHTTGRIRALGTAVGLDAWPHTDRWPSLLRDALRLGGQEWSRWSYGDGARRAARAVEQLAGRDAHRPRSLRVLDA